MFHIWDSNPGLRRTKPTGIYHLIPNVTMLPHLETHYNLDYINIKFFLKDHCIFALTKENYKESKQITQEEQIYCELF